MGKIIQGNFGKKSSKNSDCARSTIKVSRKFKASGFIGEHVGKCPECGADMVLIDFRHNGQMGYCVCETPDLECLYKCLVPLIDRTTREGLQEAKDLMQERLDLNDEQWDAFTRGLVSRDKERRAAR